MTEGASIQVLVLGATGRFGAIVDLLLRRGYRVRAATRDPASQAASDLLERGAEVVQADFDDIDSLKVAAHGVDAVFASGTAHKAGPDGEVRHGKNLVSALAASDCHLVFVSGAGADRPDGVPVLRSKQAVERALGASKLPVTLLCPVYLMENLFNPWNLSALAADRFPAPISPSLRLQEVAVSDIISLAALAFERPREFVGKRIEVASDELTGEQAARAVSTVLGRSLDACELPRDGLPSGLVALFEWLERNPTEVNIAALRERYPAIGWHRFADWAQDKNEQLASAVRAGGRTGDAFRRVGARSCRPV